MIYILHEDSPQSATTAFWNFMFQGKVSPQLSNISVTGFGGNKRLADQLKAYKFDPRHTYIILADMVLDNPRALRYYNEIIKTIKPYNNVYLADLLCFEYMMLRFRYFVRWTEPIKTIKGYQEAKLVRDCFIKCVDSGVSWVNDPKIVAYIVKKKGINTSQPNWRVDLSKISSENVATLLLSEMTNSGATDFSISKTYFGDCWTCNCCIKYNNSIGCEKCSIYVYKKTAIEKARNLWNGTVAKQIVNNAVK